MEESNDVEAHLEDEITLLKAMYPDELQFNGKTQELTYTTSSQATLRLRASSSPSTPRAFPDIVFATGPLPQKPDLRDKYRHMIKEAHLEPDEPILDSLVNIFNELIESSSTSEVPNPAQLDSRELHNSTFSQQEPSSMTIIIWLHHLLATSKRKQALSPPSGIHGAVSGLTKPGYPGIMIFSGPSAEVDEHVQALKALNWQAFQVRYEDDQLWNFKHGSQMKEVETMGEVVEAIGEERKAVFMEAMRMK